MNKLSSLYWLMIVSLLLLLTGCELGPRNGDAAAFTPPPPNQQALPAPAPPVPAPTAAAPQPAQPPVMTSQQAVPAAQPGSPVVRFEPLTRQINLNEIATIQIRLDNVTNLTEIDLQLRFNPSLLDVLDANSTQAGIQIQPGDLINPAVVTVNQVDNAAGVIDYRAEPLPVTGSGLLATINFRGKNPGLSDLTFILVNLYSNGQPVAVAPTQQGQIGVNQPVVTFTPAPIQPVGTVTPTPAIVAATTPTPTFTPSVTPTPTQTPTPTPTNTPAAQQVFIPPDATKGRCYRVQPGDTLTALAQANGVTPGFISVANDLNPPGHIYPQQVIFLPTQFGNGPNVYLVQSGDTLASVAEACQLDVGFLAQVNGQKTDANLAGVPCLIIPRPPFPPPSRYPYRGSVWPPPCWPADRCQ